MISLCETNPGENYDTPFGNISPTAPPLQYATPEIFVG